MKVVFSVIHKDEVVEIARAEMYGVPRQGEIVNLQLSGTLESLRYIHLRVASVTWDAFAHANYQYEPFGLVELVVIGVDDESRAYIEQCLRESA